jgi:hypothetical protein
MKRRQKACERWQRTGIKGIGSAKETWKGRAMRRRKDQDHLEMGKVQ